MQLVMVDDQQGPRERKGLPRKMQRCKSGVQKMLLVVAFLALTYKGLFERCVSCFCCWA
jgi:hypothetical protein